MKTLVSTGIVALGVVVLLRVFAPSLVVGHVLGYALALIWPFALSLAAALHKGASISPASAAGALVQCTALLGAVFTVFALKLLPSQETLPSWTLLLFGAFGGVFAFGWWLLFRRSRPENEGHNTASPILFVAFILAVAALVISGYLRFQ